MQCETSDTTGPASAGGQPGRRLTPPRPELPPFLQQGEHSVLLFGGKGGVGKTTCAVATALALASRFPALAHVIVSIDPAHSLDDSLAGSPLPPNLTALEIDPAGSLQTFKARHTEALLQIALHGTILDPQDVGQILDLALPGLDEAMAFHEITELLRQQPDRCILVDMAPTGHALRFLGLSELLGRWLAAADAMLEKHRYLTRLYRGAPAAPEPAETFLQEMLARVEGLGRLLRDPGRCLFVPVMAAEPLSVLETGRLLARLAGLGIPVSDVLVNRLFPAQTACPSCGEAARGQQAVLGRLPREISARRVWSIPAQGGEVQGVAQLSRFWDGLQPLPATPAPPAPPARHGFSPCGGAPSPRLPRVTGALELPGPAARLLLFAGKGGVGKTTLACSTALHLARQRPPRQVLLVSTDPAHSVSDCLGQPVGPRPVRITDGLSAVELDAGAQLAQLRRQYAREVEALFGSLSGGGAFDLAFDREVVARLVDLSPPGLDEVMALTWAMALLDSRKYDVLVLDTAPSGHLIRLLELPELVQQWLRVFYRLLLKYRKLIRLPRFSELLLTLSGQLKSLRALLADPARARLYLVGTLTGMALAESGDLHEACVRCGIAPSALLLNLVTQPEPGCPLCRAIAQTEERTLGGFRQRFADLPCALVGRGAAPCGLPWLEQLGGTLYRGDEAAADEAGIAV